MKSVKNTTFKLATFAIAMFGFGYLMVPLYDVFCDVTGINGKTGEISLTEAKNSVIDLERLVTVEFDTNVNSELPWKFKALKYKIKVHPGQVAEAIFFAENQSKEAVVGQAVPSVAPPLASLYFNKTECFCFDSQILEPGEGKEMVVRFVVDSQLPKKVTTLTLSYTFFNVTDTVGLAPRGHEITAFDSPSNQNTLKTI